MRDAVGIQAINNENEAARFDEAVNGYFRVPSSTSGRRMAPQPAENDPQKCLKELKRLLRDAEATMQAQFIRRLHSAILHQLKRSKTSPTVFYRTVALCQEIFKRSAVFRSLIATQTSSFFDQLLLAAGEDPNTNVSRALRSRNWASEQLTTVLGLIETWKFDFGDKYPSLVAGYSLLVERGYQFPHVRERQQENRERESDTRRHRERVNSAKKQQRDREMNQYVPEMEQVLVEMNRVFEILVPTLDAFHMEEDTEEKATTASDTVGMNISQVHSDGQSYAVDNDTKWEDVTTSLGTGVDAEDEDDVEWESVEAEGDDAFEDNTTEGDDTEEQMDINEIVQAYGLGSSSYQLTIEVSKQVCEESSENDALFRTLADGALRIRKRFLPLLNDWEQHSTLGEQFPSGTSKLQPQHEVLQRIYDLRDRMTHALLKWDDLVQGSTKPNRNDSVQSSVVSVPLDSYNLPTKRNRRA